MAATKTLYITAFVFAVTIGLTTGDCESGLTQCYSTFLQNVASHVTNVNAICNDMQTFVACVFQQNCGLTAEIETQLIEQMNSQLRQLGLKCSFSAADLINKYKNGATSISTLPSALMLLALVTVSILVKIF
ncbi:uncharacterized protein LOC131930733 [Physella acuta]|uniref:uncharacterized protein LOC131930733 n=1 Tax=Physella acuta TaxID=109671 RepID=UPI0027DC7D90|nr:uncharacterized protein LOC131930733 [Physella acuta]